MIKNKYLSGRFRELIFGLGYENLDILILSLTEIILTQF